MPTKIILPDSMDGGFVDIVDQKGAQQGPPISRCQRGAIKGPPKREGPDVNGVVADMEGGQQDPL